MIDWNRQNTEEWRELGFYYHEVGGQWQFYGSKSGLHNFVSLLDDYTKNEDLDGISEHEHYGPYMMKIMTWDKAIITDEYIAGTISDLKTLKDIIAYKLNLSVVGGNFNIDTEYGIDNTATAKFFIMADDFDPPSMDENLFK